MAATPSSANLAATMTDETGSGSLVFGTSPTLHCATIDGANPYVQFNNGSAVTVAAGKLWYDGSTGSWNAGMGGGTSLNRLVKNCLFTAKHHLPSLIAHYRLFIRLRAVGASGVIQFAPTVSGHYQLAILILGGSHRKHCFKRLWSCY